MKLSGTVIGARVHHFKDVRLKSTLVSGPPTITLERPGKNVIGFGLQHISASIYKQIALDQSQSAGTYVPRWLESLARSAGTVSRTLILLEFPPFDPAVLEIDAIDGTIGENIDAILNHSLRLLRPLFKAGTNARRCDWVLDGCDLRYRYETRDGSLVQGDWGLRHSLHRDLERYDDLGEWKPSKPDLRAYYEYLTGLSDDKGGYDRLVEQVVVALKNRDAPRRRAIFSQGAAYCRTIWAGVPEDAKRAAIAFFGAKLYEIAEQIVKDNIECYMDESVAKGVVQYGLGEQLMNLGLLGYLLSDGGGFDNVVIVAGDDHLQVLGTFLAAMEHRPFLSCTCWSGEAKKDEHIGFHTELPKPIDVT